MYIYVYIYIYIYIYREREREREINKKINIPLYKLYVCNKNICILIYLSSNS